MNEKKTANLATDSKKPWITPVIQVIQLNSAQNTTGSTKYDGKRYNSVS